MRDFKKQTFSTVRKICPFHAKHRCPYDGPWMMMQWQLLVSSQLYLGGLPVCVLGISVYEESLCHSETTWRYFWPALGFSCLGHLMWCYRSQILSGRGTQCSPRKHKELLQVTSSLQLMAHNSQNTCPAMFSYVVFLPGNWEHYVLGIRETRGLETILACLHIPIITIYSHPTGKRSKIKVPPFTSQHRWKGSIIELGDVWPALLQEAGDSTLSHLSTVKPSLCSKHLIH